MANVLLRVYIWSFCNSHGFMNHTQHSETQRRIQRTVTEGGQDSLIMEELGRMRIVAEVESSENKQRCLKDETALYETFRN